jgi:hypothetical protein
MKTFFTVTALAEAGAGLALLGLPSVFAALVLGSPLETPVALTVGRLAGVALFTLAIACWHARHDEQSHAAAGLVAAMFFYNAAVAALLTYAGLRLGLRGDALWPIVVIHAAMAIWCVVCLRTRRPDPGAKTK